MADWYRGRAFEVHGAGLDDRFRLWFTDNAGHDTPKDRAATSHVVGYRGSLFQALLDLDRWVVDGVEPPPSSGYRLGADNEVVLAESPHDRGGIQPLVRLAVDGAERADVAVGTEIELRATASVPPGAGHVVTVEWDVDGTGDFVDGDPIAPAVDLMVNHSHRYVRPGTYFPTVRVGAQRDGTMSDPHTVVTNLAKVRVVVS